MSETIFALASGLGGGVAVMRVSGPRSRSSLQVLAPGAYLPRRAQLKRLVRPDSRETLDEALVLFFEGPRSYTGEDVVEYHLHGGRAVIEGMIEFLSGQPGHRVAEPGEFTRRAFENGRMDLTEAEAVADLVAAETQAQKDQALLQMGGALYDLYRGWAERLSKLLAHVEADIEFPDEDMPEGVSPQAYTDVEAIRHEILNHLNDNRRGERLRGGVQVVIVGAPNAGKSSLVNALAQRDVAITSDIAGTTRDVIEVHLDLGGYPVVLADTAGLRPDQIGHSGQEGLESEGIRRAIARAESADIVVLLFDGTTAIPDPHTLALIDERSLLVTNKMDFGGARNQIDSALPVSVRTGVGLEAFLGALVDKIKALVIDRSAPCPTRPRHRRYLEDTIEALERALDARLPEMMAEDLRLSVRALGRITGKVDVEDLLDVIFRDFCIGK